MRVKLFGAGGGQVTGSAYLVEVGKSKVLVDCGLFQGVPNSDERNRIPAEFRFKKLDGVLITHAHLDHTGRLPILAQREFSGSVWSTAATAELAGLILRDAAKIQAGDALRRNRKLQRAGKPPVVPLYSTKDVDAIMSRFRTVAYETPTPIADGIVARFIEAGHLLGSASIELTMTEGSQKRVVVFSGDLGQRGAPLTRFASRIEKADAVFLEATYGNRNHKVFRETLAEFTEVVRAASSRGGKILVPTFAVGRAQLLVVLVAWLFRTKKVKPFPVYLDSPMAIEASRIYLNHPELWHDTLKEIVKTRPLRDDLIRTGSKVITTPAESRALSKVSGTCMILAGAGMCNAGRILHHLHNSLGKPETSVVFVGHQCHGTPGRALVDGAKTIKILGEPVEVRASIHTLGGFSGHAGQSDLLDWLAPMAAGKARVFVTHGEDGPRKALADLIRSRFGIVSDLPGHLSTLEL